MPVVTNRLKKAHSTVPANISEVNLAIAEIGAAQSEIDRVNQKLREEIARLRAEAAEKVGPLATLRDNQINSVFAYASANREELTSDGSKTVKLDTGKLLWRVTPPAVATNDDDRLIEVLSARGLHGLIRVKAELDRNAILAAREQLEDAEIPGLSFTSREEFVVVPNTSCTEATVTVTQTIDV